MGRLTVEGSVEVLETEGLVSSFVGAGPSNASPSNTHWDNFKYDNPGT